MSTFNFDAINANPEAASCDARFHVSEFHKSNSGLIILKKKSLFFSASERKKWRIMFLDS
jgi:hypothetical protein